MPRKTVKNNVETAAPIVEETPKRQRKAKSKPAQHGAVQMVQSALIRAGSNDRKHFDEAALNDLAASIQKNGLAQPITVRPMNGGEWFEIVAGERRFRAMSHILGWTEVPAIVRELSDEDASSIMLVENTSRVDLDPIAEANAYRVRVNQFNWPVEKIAEAAGVSQERVKNRLALLELADDVQHFVKIGQFPQGHALLLVGLDKDRQRIGLKAFNTAKHMPYTRFQDVVSQLRTAQEAESQISMFDLELLVMSSVENDVATPLRGKGAVTGAPISEKLPAVKTGGKDSVGDIFDRYISQLINAGEEGAAAAVGTIYNALVVGNWVSIPANSVLAKTADTQPSNDETGGAL